MRVSFLRLAAAAMLSLALAGCEEKGGEAREKTASYRYKLTIAVNTPDGIKRASSVGEVQYRKVLIPERGIMDKLQGDALYLDLGPGARPLIALLTSRLTSQLHHNYGKPFDWQRGKDGWSPDSGPGQLARIYGLTPSRDFMDDVRRIAQMRGARAIPPADLPDLVTFADINDPKSVIEVDPSDLPATLGPHITWNELTLEITDEPITRGIRTNLPWLGAYHAGNLRLDGSQFGPNKGLANILSWADFEKIY